MSAALPVALPDYAAAAAAHANLVIPGLPVRTDVMSGSNHSAPRAIPKRQPAPTAGEPGGRTEIHPFSRSMPGKAAA